MTRGTIEATSDAPGARSIHAAAIRAEVPTSASNARCRSRVTCRWAGALTADVSAMTDLSSCRDNSDAGAGRNWSNSEHANSTATAAPQRAERRSRPLPRALLFENVNAVVPCQVVSAAI
jgi:hypothetical protein